MVRGIAVTAPQQLYYGVTSQRRQIELAVRGNRLSNEDLLSFVILPHDDSYFVPPSAGFAFRNGKLAWHQAGRISAGPWQAWFTAALSQGGSKLTGIMRQWSNFGRVIDTGAIRYSARRFAAENGYEWAGKTSVGAPLTVLVGYKLVPATLSPRARASGTGSRRSPLEGKVDFPSFALAPR